MKIRHDYVLITEAVKEEKTAGGIILSAGAELDKASKPGVVLAYGPDVDGLFTGDMVYLDWTKAMPVNVDRKAAVIIKDEFVKAYIRSE